MPTDIEPALTSLFGSRTRLLTLAVLANSSEPLTGYRIAKLASLPREKVYPELRKGAKAGLVAKVGKGFRLTDPDVRALLQKRVRIRWDEEWDRARPGWNETAVRDLRKIQVSLSAVPLYNPQNRIPPAALRELQRDPAKNRILSLIHI